MANQYGVNYQGRKLALAYVSPHPNYEGHIIVSVIPLVRKGKWVDNTLETKLEFPLHDIFPDTKPEIDAVYEVVSSAELEPWKVEIKDVENC